MRQKRMIFVRGLTCVCSAGVKQCVCVGDKLQLSVQVRQEATRQNHVHLTITFDFHPVYVCCHIQRSQRGSDVYLQQERNKVDEIKIQQMTKICNNKNRHIEILTE